jgi:hypothetical protein
MKALLLATVTALAVIIPTTTNAATVASLGVNPTSTTGAFASPPTGTGGTGLGAFSDQVNFTLSGGPAFLTIASVTNVSAKPSDFITNFVGRVLFLGSDGVLSGAGTAADTTVIGPVAASACPLVANCQGFAGTATLTLVGNYALSLTGIGGGTSGYGGNLAVAQIPIPPAIGLFALGLAGIALIRRRQKTT